MLPHRRMMPHRVEAAPSGRAKCRACKSAISKGDPRFAEVVPNPVAEGLTSHFYHPACAAQRRPEAFLQLLEGPREEGAEELPGAIAELEPQARLAVEHRRLARLGVISAAPSGRARCRHCGELLATGELRLAVQPIDEGRLQAWGFLHVGCIVAYAGIHPGADRTLRYSNLTEAEAAAVRGVLEKATVDHPPPKEQPSDA